MRAFVVILLASIVLACRGNASPAPAQTTTCGAGEVAVDGGCAPQPVACDDLSVATAEGCVRVGVPDGACVEGFVADGEGGCEAVLPMGMCPKGKMAIPGEKECRDIMPCGTGTWGDIPLEKGALFVDGSYTGADADGTQAHPYPKIQAALEKAAGNPMIAIAAGKYDETVTATRPMRIWGRCPSMVEMRGGIESDAFSAPLLVRSSVEVHGISFTGPAAGLVVAATNGMAIVDSVWVHDTGVSGLIVARKGVDTKITIRNSLIENALEYGVLVAEVTGTIERSVIRGTRSRTTDGLEGQGLVLNGPSGKLDADIVVTRSVIEGNHTQNIYAERGSLRVEASVIRLAEGRASDKLGGLGIEVEATKLTVVDSSIVDNRVVGVVVAGSSALFDRTTVARTRSDDLKRFGAGVFATFSFLNKKTSTEMTVRDSSVHHVREFGILAYGCPLTVERSRVAHVMGQETSTFYGDGIMVSAFTADLTSPKFDASGKIDRTLVIDVARAGVSVWAASASIGETRLACTGFDIELSRVYNTAGSNLEGDYAIEDLGNNSCGCKNVSATCKAQLSSLPPVPSPKLPK